MLRVAILTIATFLCLGQTAAWAVLVVVTNGVSLTRFDSFTPGNITMVTVTGLQPGEQLIGIDFRPANGVLYGLGDTKRLYTLNFNSGAATLVGAVGNYNLLSNNFGTSFNAVDDVLRVANNVSLNLRINPETGALVQQDGALADQGIAAIAYTNQFPNASTTTLYGINSTDGTLVRIGPENAYAGAINSGGMNVIGSLTLGDPLNPAIGFDIAQDGGALAAITAGGESRLYFIYLNTGLAELIGPIGNGATSYRGLAIRHGPVTFTNPGTILIPATSETNGSGKANPYPSNLTVSDISLPIRKVKVTLRDFRHHYPDDVDILLRSPAGGHMVIWSDVGGNTDNSTCGATCDNGPNPGTTGVTITLDDAATDNLPDNTLLTSGTFRPTNSDIGADTFPDPAPAGPHENAAPSGSATFASTFNDTNPNGIWSLYVVDDGGGDTGRVVNGWSIEVTSGPPCTMTCSGNFTVNNSPDQCGSFFFHPNPAVSGACGTIAHAPASGSLFPIGTTTVTTTSSSGASCTFDITVNDAQAPALACHENITKQADPGQNSTTANFAAPNASDNCPGVTASYSPPSGSFFAVGTTTVTETATDSAGLTISCTFTVTVTPNGGPTPTSTPDGSATPTPTPPASSLANISTRLRVEGGDNVLIGGFIVTGSEPKKLLVRAIGPSLSFDDRLANPKLELFSGQSLIATNDNWQDSLNRQEIIDTTIPPTNDLESAIIGTVNPGAYTAVVSGVDGGTGVGVVEAYDLSPNINSRLANIATRGLIQTGDNIMIAGTIVIGQASQRVIIRAIGPSLPLAGRLEDPSLELRDSNGGLIATNNNWRSDQETEIIATTIPPTNDLESAITGFLPPASYTAILRGVNDTTGIAVIEVYALE